MTEDEAKAVAKDLGSDWEPVFDGYGKVWYVRDLSSTMTIRGVEKHYSARDSSFAGFGSSPTRALRDLENICWRQAQDLRREANELDDRARAVKRVIERLKQPDP